VTVSALFRSASILPRLPELEGRSVANPADPVVLPAASYSFFELSGPVAAPCHSSEPVPSSAESTTNAPG
jgi:hypothetical protein